MHAGTGQAYQIRPGKPEDLGFLWEMLYEAIHWGPEKTDPKPPREKLLAEPDISHYLKGWGRERERRGP